MISLFMGRSCRIPLKVMGRQRALSALRPHDPTSLKAEVVKQTKTPLKPLKYTKCTTDPYFATLIRGSSSFSSL